MPCAAGMRLAMLHASFLLQRLGARERRATSPAHGQVLALGTRVTFLTLQLLCYAGIQASAVRTSLALVQISPGAAPSSLSSCLSTPQAAAGLFTQWPAEHRLIAIRPQTRSLEGSGSSLQAAAEAGWVAVAVPLWRSQGMVSRQQS